MTELLIAILALFLGAFVGAALVLLKVSRANRSQGSAAWGYAFDDGGQEVGRSGGMDHLIAEGRIAGEGMPAGLPAEMTDKFRLMAELGSIEGSPLVAVVAVGREDVTKLGRVELLALELRQTGGLGSYTVSLSSSLAHAWMSFPEVELADDLGTAYLAANTGQGGGGTIFRGSFAFAPGPPAGATWLDVTFLRFGGPDLMMGFPGTGRRTTPVAEGPWRFRVPLDRLGRGPAAPTAGS